MKLSNLAYLIKPSATLSITAKAKEMKKQGLDVVSLAAGEPDFDTPLNIKQKAKEAIDQGFTKYTPSSGILELKKAICDKFLKENNLIYQPSQILVSNGAKQALAIIILTLVGKGDEVIIPSPYWVSYEEMVKIAGAKPKIIKTKDGYFKLDPDSFKKAINKKTRVLILNSPLNPVGAVYDLKELKEIADICLKNNIFVLSDEVYEKLVYEKKHISIASLGEKIKKLTIIVNGVSKTYSMTGWRIGYAAAEEEIIQAATRIQDHLSSNPCSISQKAALEALTGSQESVLKMVREYKKRRDFLVAELNKIKGIKAFKPDGAFYVFADVSKLYNKKIKNSFDFSKELLEKFYVAVIPGSAFGNDNFIRLSFATAHDQIKKAVERIKQFCQELN